MKTVRIGFRNGTYIDVPVRDAPEMLKEISDAHDKIGLSRSVWLIFEGKLIVDICQIDYVEARQ